MDDKVFELYMKIYSVLDKNERSKFKLGFNLGITEGISQCTARLKERK